MRPIPGAKPPDPKDLVRVRDRLTFLYVERCTINRDSNAITVADGHGIAHVPAAVLSVLLLGPGVRITHSAVSVLSESGSTIVWMSPDSPGFGHHAQRFPRVSGDEPAFTKVAEGASGVFPA